MSNGFNEDPDEDSADLDGGGDEEAAPRFVECD